MQERKETRSRVAKECESHHHQPCASSTSLTHPPPPLFVHAALSKKKGAREAVEEKLENKMRKKQNHSMHKTSHHRQQSTNTNRQPHPLPRHSSTLAHSSTAHTSSRAIHPGAVIPNPHALQLAHLSIPQGGQSGVTSSPRGNTLGRPMIHHHTTGSIPGDCLRYV